jgi:hypothetical protein
VIFGLSFDGEISFPASMVMLKDYNSLGCREEDCPRSFCIGCYILDNGDSFSRLSRDVDKAVRLLFPDILLLVLLSRLIEYFNGCCVHASLAFAAQIKFMREPSLIFTGLWFIIYLWLSSENYKIMSWKKKGFKDFEDLLVF